MFVHAWNMKDYELNDSKHLQILIPYWFRQEYNFE
jgi:hypothetical protein